MTDESAGDQGVGGRTESGWSTGPTDPTLSFPERIGPYRLIELLGRGGMGSVFLAEQTKPIKRQVALKLIFSTVNSDQTLRRFEAERQALAMMNHPHIAQVYDAGATEKGEPYVVMEYVAGAPITEHCDINRLSVRHRLELMISVCEGVHHAHQKGIIHRDLKPSNVMVLHNGKAVPKIIDFGIAKATDEQLTDFTLLTREGAIVGTPVYMSPERIKPRGDIDTRADIYSLGVLLYELLTGELPFADDGSPFEIAERVMSGEVARPSTKVTSTTGGSPPQVAERRGTDSSTLAKRLTGDLDWITLKAMARERERRYSSATELAADLRRHLNREPVEARPPTLAYRVDRFVWRHRLGVAAGILVALSLVAGIIGTSMQASRANLEAERANLEAERANLEADRANNEAATAKQVSDFLVELFELSDPTEAQGDTITAREILDRGAAKIDQELADQPITQARLQTTIAGVYFSLGLYEPAGELFSKALATRELMLDAPHPELADSLSWMGATELSVGELETSEAYFMRALEIEEQIEDEDPSRMALLLTRMASLYKVQGKYDEAEAVLERTRDLLADTDQPLHLVNTLITLGQLKARAGRYVEAEAFHREALQLLETEFNPDHPDIGAVLSDLGSVLNNLGRYDEAQEALERSLAILEAVYEEGHPNIVSTRLNLALFYRSVGKLEESIELYEQALASQVQKVGSDDRSNALLVFNLSNLYEGVGRLSEAKEYAEWALRIFSASLPSGHHYIGVAEQQLAHLLQTQGRTSEAAPHAERALDILIAAVGLDHFHTALALNLVAKISMSRGRPDRAEELFLKAGEALTANDGAGDVQTAIEMNLRDYATLLRSLGRDDEAADLEAQASAIADSQP